MIVRTGAILIYGQERANVSSAIARRASLLPYCPEFPALMTATPLSATRLDALVLCENIVRRAAFEG